MTQIVKLNNESPSEFTSGVDYETTASMRLSKAMDMMQKLNFASSFDNSVKGELDLWIQYYMKIKPMIDIGDFESVFLVDMP